jgi:hypothetical protein
MLRAAQMLDLGSHNHREAWDAMSLIHEALGNATAPGSLPSEEAINSEHGPTFLHYAEVFVRAINKLAGQGR